MKMNPFVFCLLLLAGLSHLSAQPAERYVSRKDTPIGIDQARSGWLNNPARADSATGFDIQKYEIFLNINHTNHYIQGNVLATVLAEENLSSIQYNLEALTVTQVLVDGTPVAFTHQNGLINIPLNVSLGQIFTTNVHYQGNPQLSPNVYSVGMIFSTNSLFTISDPDAGRYWWPSYDHPWDKAIVDLSIRLRSDWKVAANGLRESITDHGDGSSTTVWRGYNPMTTYLVCITCGPYVEVNQSAGDLPIQSFVYQNQYNNALIDLAYVPQMINFYSQVFGDYPFEKYGHAVVSMSTYSAMEHQTMTTLGNFIINGQGTYELIIAHELAHQWFGNCLSFLTFKDVWLSEGFATYSEHLWTDKRQGWQAACDYVNSSFHQYYLTWENSAGAQTIYNPTFNNYFSPATYEKAASVLHMLRLKVGNDHFFEILQTWFSTYHNQNVDTADFQAVCEQVSGLDLDQFFQQWIFSPGVPSVELSVYTKSAPAQLKVIARTTSPTSTQFHLDIPLKMNHSTHSDSLLVQANPSGAITLFEYDSSTLSSVQVDPNSWVLLRGKTLIEPVLSECLPSSGAVLLSWDSFANASGYRLYRKTATGEDWVLLNPEPLTDLTYTDTSVQNGTLYHYRFKALDSEGFESTFSNQLSAQPVAFAFNQELLIVDETRDGNGNAISPTDTMVDQFYTGALASMPHQNWDYNAQGAPSLELLGDYKVVLWHDDDFTNQYILDNLSILSGYILGGGKLVVSGWKTASALNSAFLSRFCGGVELVYDNSAVLISAESDIYPHLYPDPLKLTANWNGMLPMIYTFGGDANSIYTANMNDTANGAGLSLAFRAESLGTLVLFGFPLYFMLPDGVHQLLAQLLPELNPNLPVLSEDIPNLPFTLNAYPNPFFHSLNIHLIAPEKSATRISIYNLRGQKVRSFEVVSQKDINWDCLDETGKPASSGVYFLKAESGNQTITKKVLLLQK